MALATIQTRLCPHCANSIALDALTCPYCKADLLHSNEPEWPQRDEDTALHAGLSEKEKLPVRSKVILVLGLVVFALGVYLAGGNRERSDLGPVLAEQQRGLQEKDEKIETLEAQLAQLRQEHQGSTGQIEELKAKLQESQRDLNAARTKLSEANRELDRVVKNRSATAQRSVTRVPDQPRASASASSSPARRAAEPGLYETMRATSVHEQPAGSARIVNQIAKGTQVTVVRSIGDWLEIRSKHGNPQGYIRADDAILAGRSN
ncbi:MAG TPA: SH3 domain-containing protein [Candidatus Binatia bacterium]